MHGLVALREIFVEFAVMVLFVGALVVAVTAGGCGCASASSGVVAVVVAALGASAVLASRRLERPLDCTDDATLASSYVARSMLRVAFANVAAVVGMVGASIAHTWWIFVVGLGFTVFGLRRAAPTDEHLAADQAMLSASGCSRSIVAALEVLPPGPSNRRRSGH